MSSIGGKHAYNNGVIQKFFNDDDVIPEGFIRGVLPQYADRLKFIANNQLGAKWDDQRRKEKSIERQKYYETHPGTRTGCSLSQETRDKISKSHKGKPAPNKGKHLTDQQKEKIKQTKIEKYGSLEEANRISVEHMQNTKLKKYGNKSFVNPEKAKNTIQQKINDGQDFWGDRQKKTEQTLIEHFGSLDEYHHMAREKAKETLLNKYGVEHQSQIRDVAIKKVITAKTAVAIDDTVLDSNYEVIVYNYFYSNNYIIKRNIPIKFEYEGKFHITFIDFEVNDTLIEVKGGHLLSGCFDYATIPINIKLDLYKKYNVIVITNDIEHNKNLLGEIKCFDIERFKNPKFNFFDEEEEDTEI